MPFCPKCRDEFQDWVKVCPDCGVELVEKLEPLPERVRPASPPPLNLVTVATFSYPAEAYLASAKLESEGIQSTVADDYIVTIYWMLSNAIGGVKLQVREEDAETAAEVLRTPVQNAGSEFDTEETCPECHSPEIQYETFNLRLIFACWLITDLFIPHPRPGTGFILPFLKRKWRCKVCGHQWKNRN
jgi:hypothetical protein